MSTDYRLLKVVAASDLFDGRLEKYGVREHSEENPWRTEQKRVLTDGLNYLWVYINHAGLVRELTRSASCGDPGRILGAIADAFNAEIVSEHEPQFWGFDTQEEWDAWQENAGKEVVEEFYNELLKYLRGEPHEIRPGTIDLMKAEIAGKLVEKDPTLLLLENKDKLLDEVSSTYNRNHASSVTLSPQDLDALKRLVTHEEELSFKWSRVRPSTTGE